MSIENDNLKLTDFVDLPTLQEIQDSFAAVANVRAVFTDADGNRITHPTPTTKFMKRQRAIAQAEESRSGPARNGREYIAPIIVNNQRVGSIRMDGHSGAAIGFDDAKLVPLAEKFRIDLKQMKSLASSLTRSRDTRPAAIQFLFLLANAIARLCYQEFQLRQRISELTAVTTVATMLSESRDLNEVLKRTVRIVCEVMEVKAASIRLIDEENDELVIKAVWNLSNQYLAKGPVRLSKSLIDAIALSERGFEYVRNMAEDDRVQYPQEAAREGIVSIFSIGMRYKSKAIGVLRVYTAHEHTFSAHQINVLKAIAAQAAAAIENTRLLTDAIASEALEKQVRMAAEVQQRMLPQRAPNVPGVELAAVYVPSLELGGDFYDFIPLPDDNLGLVIADVSSKGVPASLVMASVRAALRAQVDNLYYLYEVMQRLNLMLPHDSKVTEFVTLFYGVLDAKNRRLTYCNAGHPPPLILRDGKLMSLESDNLVLGVDPMEKYDQHLVELLPGDLLLLYTDGLPDAVNFSDEHFGTQRVRDSFAKGGQSAESVAQNILWDMRRFAGLTRRADDVTLVVARIT